MQPFDTNVTVDSMEVRTGSFEIHSDPLLLNTYLNKKVPLDVFLILKTHW